MGDATTCNPSAGARFLTRDPLEALTRSAYGYVGNNPINAVDPSGLIGPLAIGLGYLAVEAGLSLWDAYDAYSTFSNGCSSDAAKWFSGGTFLMGVLLPGGGYGSLDNVARWSDNLIDGSRVHVDDALDAAEDFLGPGYRDVGGGRLLSSDGRRQVRMSDDDLLGRHAHGPHLNFDRISEPNRRGQQRLFNRRHIDFWE